MYKISIDLLKNIKKALKDYERAVNESTKTEKKTKKFNEIKKLNKQLEEYNI